MDNNYKLTSRVFSRTWRRSKNYSSNELRWLARKRGLTFKSVGTTITLTDNKLGKTFSFKVSS